MSSSIVRAENNDLICVDDDQDILDFMKAVIENSHHTVVTAGSAEQGLTSYKERKPDLVIVDLMMEEADSGVNFVKEIRALGPTPPVYLMSSVGESLALIKDCSVLDLAGVLQKPIKSQTLLSILKPN